MVNECETILRRKKHTHRLALVFEWPNYRRKNCKMVSYNGAGENVGMKSRKLKLLVSNKEYTHTEAVQKQTLQTPVHKMRSRKE